MNRPSSSPRFSVGFVLPWFGTTIAAFAFAGPAPHYPGGFPPNNGSAWSAGAAVFGLLIGAITGLVVGGAPAVVPRRRSMCTWRWVAASAAGLAIVHAI